MDKPFLVKKCYLLTLDPVHIGTGGYRLGRVDNTIVREPATKIPKIPATGIAGALRSFMAMRNDKYPQCAGQGQHGETGDESNSRGHCGEHTCPVCMSFGFSKPRKSFQGLVQLTDALLLFIPVYSRLGPVWVTAPMALNACGFKSDTLPPGNILRVCKKLKDDAADKLNLGWLLLPVDEQHFEFPKELSNVLPKSTLERTVLVSDGLFSRVVNDNLEVRTSVAINPDTGAAVDGALFTYEAIPRMVLLQFEMVINEPSSFRVPPEGQTPGLSKGELWEKMTKAAEYLQWLGMGGMNTRGLGRMEATWEHKEGNQGEDG